VLYFIVKTSLCCIVLLRQVCVVLCCQDKSVLYCVVKISLCCIVLSRQLDKSILYCVVKTSPCCMVLSKNVCVVLCCQCVYCIVL